MKMTQEQKDLLLKDLCARLPYGVKCEVIKYRIDGEMVFIRNGSSALELTVDNVKELVTNNLYTINPYLFPISSMSEDQKYEFYLRFIVKDCDCAFDYFKFYLDNGKWHKLLTSLDYIEVIIDWFHKNHIDYRGLIPMGLVIDATGLNIY